MRVTIILLALAGLSACNQESGNEKPTDPATPAALSYEGADYKDEAAKIAHGQRLATIFDCTGCHGSNLQGADISDSPKDGAMFAPNIALLLTKYSDADLDKLIRHGVPIDGREFWFMPVESFQFLSDADVAAIIAYLRTFKAGGKPVPPFKFNSVEQRDVDLGRLGNAQAQIRKYRDDPPVDLGPNHAWGRYLAQTACTSCHNNALQGWEDFTPNLDIAGTYSKAELTHLLTTGEGKTWKDLGMMSSMVRRHLSYMTPRERAAVVDYVLARANRPQPADAN